MCGESTLNVPCRRPSPLLKLSLPGENRASVGQFPPSIDSLATHPHRPCHPPHLSHGAFEEHTLSSEFHAGLPPQRADRPGGQEQEQQEHPPAYRLPAAAFPGRPPHDASSHKPGRRTFTAGLHRFNTAPAGAAEAVLLACCGSRRWALRLVAHRPYPDLDALLAAADEASYDLSFADLAEALADESSSGPHHGAPAAARTALRAAHAAYEAGFGHAFVISLDGARPEEYLDQVLAALRTRLAHDPDEERSVAADELRRLARSRLAHLVLHSTKPGHRHSGRV
jgi:2-oxo-4-hydroxy-4-carboxy-5-ureidoimidazoline decarboxylase